MASFTYIANWKMNVSLQQAKRFYEEHWEDLDNLTATTNSSVVLCPSFVALNIYSTGLPSKNLHLGAQDCSPYTSGPYTGDIDALSLHQLGCTFCIVGHSERRRTHQESNELIAQKVAQLQLQKITPIVCIGESAQEKEAGKTLAILEQQLKPVLTVTAATEGSLCIAYEPIWAIGSGNTPHLNDLTHTIATVKNYVETYTHKKIPFLYGGSVTSENISALRTVPLLSGVLIGSASTDFNSLKKIVS